MEGSSGVHGLTAGGAWPDRWAVLGYRSPNAAASACGTGVVQTGGARQGSQEGLTGGLHYSSSRRGQRDSKWFKMIKIILNDLKTIQTLFDPKTTFPSSKFLK
jgi:hypothetical protein